MLIAVFIEGGVNCCCIRPVPILKLFLGRGRESTILNVRMKCGYCSNLLLILNVFL